MRIRSEHSSQIGLSEVLAHKLQIRFLRSGRELGRSGASIAASCYRAAQGACASLSKESDFIISQNDIMGERIPPGW
jgi:hypothetical protein